METPEALFEKARQRALEARLPYAGALLADEAQALLQSNAGARLVDVRTKAELEWVGRVPGAIEIEWNSWPGSQPNTNFIAQLQAAVPAGTPLLFMCRSGVRSHNAATAATQAGFAQSINVLQGFEGDKDPLGQRNNIGGWRKAGLPWTQS
jgi:rhodanese-related sulfurtransferase